MRKIRSLFYYLLTYWYYKLILGKLGYRTRIFRALKLEMPQNIFIGNKVTIFKYTWLAANPLTGEKTCKLIIGDGSSIGNFNHIYATSKIELGKSVLTADKVYISDNQHEFSDVGIPVIDQPIKQIKNVLIGDGAWLGENVCIMGANVGKGSVIGANSVVTKDIPDYCVAVGTPAKIIKRYSFEKKEWLKTNDKGEFIN